MGISKVFCFLKYFVTIQVNGLIYNLHPYTHLDFAAGISYHTIPDL